MWKEPPTSANETTAILNAPRPRRCVIVDFELPRRRHPDENDFEWAMARAHDEEHGLLWFHLRSDLIGALYEDCKVHDTLCWSDLSLRTQENLFSRPEEELHPLPPLSRRERRMYYDSILIGQYWSRHGESPSATVLETAIDAQCRVVSSFASASRGSNRAH